MNQPNISLDKTTPISCNKCQHDVFVEGVMLRKVSKFLSGTDKDGLIPIPVFSCQKCHHINMEFLPSQLQQTNEA